MLRHLLILILLLAGVRAQDGLRFLSGTTYQDPVSGHNYAYLLWQAEKSEDLRGLDFEVFSKSGAAASPGPFTRAGRMSFQTSVPVISALLDTTPGVLVNAALLEERIDSLFGSLLPAIDLSLEMKISGLLQIAGTDPEVYRRLTFFSRTHPFIGIVMGTAGSFRMPANTATFELRSTDGDAAAVEGRVTVSATSPPVIPKPGPPVHVVDEAASGHLNVKLRWGIPDALARKTALIYGYNIYRIRRAFAESAGHHLNPPGPAAITALLSSNPNSVALVNRVPILPAAALGIAEAADLAADPDTAFFTDDNGVILDGGTPLADGDQFYYYIAARDILGRPGNLSDATLVTFCDRLRPDAPVRVRVNHIHDIGSTPEDFLRVSWQAPRGGEAPDAYLVYRWENPAEMVAAAVPLNPVLNRVAGPIPHDPAVTRYSFDDKGAGAPALTPGSYRDGGDDGKTYWYSVRAVKDTACGPLSSANSSPAWGVLRDRVGPGAAGASSVRVTRIGPEVSSNPFTTRPLAPGEEASSFEGAGDHFIRLTVTRVDNRIDGAIVFRGTDNGVDPPSYVRLGAKLFAAGDDVLEIRIAVNQSYFSNQQEGLLVMARDIEGDLDYKVLAATSIPNPDNNRVVELPFIADIAETETPVTGGGVEGDGIHTTVDPGTGLTVPTVVTFNPGDEAREYKLYKRIDGGTLLLVKQGEVVDDDLDITIEDSALPANSARVCYFLQYFDEHGNPSPLVDLGCVRTTSKVEMPVPILSQGEKAGTEAAPRVTLRWFCETAGVERFRLLISDGDTNVPVDYSNDLTPELVRAFVPLPPASPFPGPGVPAPPSGSFGGTAVGFTPYLTGRVGGNFGNPARPNEFSITLNLASGRDYQFQVESVSAAGDRSLPSNTIDFTWSPAAPAIGPQVPWPARSLPPLDPGFITGVKAQYLENGREDRFYSVVKIGEITSTSPQSGANSGFASSEGGIPFRQIPYYNDATDDLELYTSRGGENALPFVLYRYQVANEYITNVSGDVVQVSPLIDRVRTGPHPEGGSLVGIHDPFIELLVDPDTGKYGVYVKDTQGVVRGSTYTYVLLRFKPNGEIDRAIPTNTLFIPFTDP
jgi:hypothetical protein